MLIVSLLVTMMAIILFIIKIPIFTIFLVIALEPFFVTNSL